MNEQQVASLRAGMRVLTAALEVDHATRVDMINDQVQIELNERGLEGVIGVILGLREIAELLARQLSAETGKPLAEVLQAVGRAFEIFIQRNEDGTLD